MTITKQCRFNVIMDLPIYMYHYIICSFHLKSPVQLVKSLTCDFEIETTYSMKRTAIRPYTLPGKCRKL